MTTSTIRFERAPTPLNTLGETPLWSATEQALYWIDCNEHALMRWAPGAPSADRWPMPDRIGGIALAPRGLIVVLARAIHHFDPASGALELIATTPLPAHVPLHECRCDRQGRLWVGGIDSTFSPDNRTPGGGAYMRLEGDRLVRVIEGVTIANGMAFSPSGDIFYAVDSGPRSGRAWTLDPATGDLSDERAFIAEPPELGLFDGATVDSDGFYWVAMVFGGALRRYRPDGALDRIVETGVSRVTMPCFGGADLSTLFVTSCQLTVAARPVNDPFGGALLFREHCPYREACRRAGGSPLTAALSEPFGNGSAYVRGSRRPCGPSHHDSHGCGPIFSVMVRASNSERLEPRTIAMRPVFKTIS